MRWKHTVVTLDGVVTSESWQLAGLVFEAHVCRDGLRFTGRLRQASIWKPPETTEATGDSAAEVRAVIEHMIRERWVSMPEAQWGLR